MGKLVRPNTYLVGATAFEREGLERYLEESGNTDFFGSIRSAIEESGLSEAECLCSMFAKLCYSALTLGKNLNVTRIRDIPDNIRACFDQGHGSVFEHVWLNFITRNCSRVFTHELVRHRVGTAFSQTSGRYCRLDSIDLVWDPILDPVKDMWLRGLRDIEDLVYLTECRLGLRRPNPDGGLDYAAGDCFYQRDKGQVVDPLSRWVPDDSFDFGTRKKITSAIRRIAPNGQANEIAWSVNIRSLRHLVMVRTAPGAEYEIRTVFGDVYRTAKAKWPLMFHGAKEVEADGLLAVSGMKLQPYEKTTE